MPAPSDHIFARQGFADIEHPVDADGGAPFATPKPSTS
jgi:hypothetical protein